MSSSIQALPRFRGDRPVYLNETNTGFKTAEEVIYAVEQLRGKGWLCAYADPEHKKTRPFHMSFNNEKDFQEFKKCCNQLQIALKAPVIKPDDLEELEAQDAAGNVNPEDTATKTYESPAGKIHIDI